jgi:hypothetical protein
MDFVSHLQRINHLFKKDARIDLKHISLYNSLFAWWYYHRDDDKVAICHKKMMRHSGIISKDIYDVTLIELDHFGYIMLLPPAEKGGACMVKMIILKPEKVVEAALPKREKENLHATMQKLVREIIDRVLLLKIHLDKEG